MTEELAPRMEPIELSQFDANGNRIPPQAWGIDQAVTFTAKRDVPLTCKSARLEIEVTRKARPYTGEPSDVSVYSQRCEKAPCSVDLPAIEVILTNGKAYKWRARIRRKSWVVHINRDGSIRCGAYTRSNTSNWVSFDNDNLAFWIREEWVDAVASPHDFAPKKGAWVPPNDYRQLGIPQDGKYLWMDSSSVSGQFTIQWLALFNVENKQNSINGTIAFISQSTKPCLQTVEILHRIAGDKWHVVDKREVGTNDTKAKIPLEFDLRSYLRPYGQEGAELGGGRIRITCEGNEPFRHGVDMLVIVYKTLDGVDRYD